MDDKIKAGFDALAKEMPFCEAARHGADLYAAPRFSVFTLFGDRETTLSRILADLFDPKGSHGQGTLFLDALLREVGSGPVPRVEQHLVEVRTEAPVRVTGRSSPGRLDILITTATHVIGIENKIWAGEGSEQLSKYWDHVLSVGGSSRESRLVFISNDTPSVGAATRLPYQTTVSGAASVDRLLASCEAGIKAPRISDFVADFRNWIARTFGGNINMSAMQPYSESVINSLADENKAKAVGAALASAEAIRRSVIDRIEDYLKQELRDAFPDIQFGTKRGAASLFEGLSRKDFGWSAQRDGWPRNCSLTIQAGQLDFRNIGYGVIALDPETLPASDPQHAAATSENIEALDSAVAHVPGNKGPWPWWRWERHADVSNWSIARLGADLVEHGNRIEDIFGARKIASDLVALAHAISSIGPLQASHAPSQAGLKPGDDASIRNA